MTRQEQKAVKELSEMISKNLKAVAREHGFKVVSDCAYKVLGDFLYEVFLSAPPVRRGTAIRAVVSTKPCVIDNVFWDVYEMGEVARKKPFSFHITAAHSPSAHIIQEMELPVPTVDAATLVMNEAFCRFNNCFWMSHRSRWVLKQWAACAPASSSGIPPSPSQRVRSLPQRPVFSPLWRSTCCKASGPWRVRIRALESSGLTESAVRRVAYRRLRLLSPLTPTVLSMFPPWTRIQGNGRRLRSKAPAT